MNNIDVPALIVKSLKDNKDNWQLGRRDKNVRTLAYFGIDSDEMLREIAESISPADYRKGPVNDDHSTPYPGPVWIFQTTILGELCYLKVQRKPDSTDFWISAHLNDLSN